MRHKPYGAQGGMALIIFLLSLLSIYYISRWTWRFTKWFFREIFPEIIDIAKCVIIWTWRKIVKKYKEWNK